MTRQARGPRSEVRQVKDQAPSSDPVAARVAPPGLSNRGSGTSSEVTQALLLVGQAKLAVGPAGDRFEQEADAVAREVVGRLQDTEAGSASIKRKAVTPGVVRSIRRRAAIGAEGGEVDADTERTIQAARSGGSPLEAGLQRSMGMAFGADFSAVRVHTGAASAALNERVQAKAFTVGNDIFFRGAMPDTTSRAGQELVAHELTHTIQQGGAVARQVDERIQRTPDTAAQELVGLGAPSTTKGLKPWLKKQPAAAEGGEAWAETFKTRHGLDKDWEGTVTPLMQKLAKAAQEEADFAALVSGLTPIPNFIGGTDKDHNGIVHGWVQFPGNVLVELGAIDRDGWFTFGATPDMKVRIVGKKGTVPQVWATDPGKGAATAKQANMSLKQKTGPAFLVDVDLTETIKRIAAGTKHPHENDGSSFSNTKSLLPYRAFGYWTEYVVPVEAITKKPAGSAFVVPPGPMRLVRGAFGECYLTTDHYDSFTAIN